MIRPLLGAGIVLAVACTVTLAADPTPADAVALIEKLKGRHLPKGSDKVTTVELGRKKVTDNDLKVIAALTTVRILNLGSEMTKDKSGKGIYKSAITDEGVKNIAGMTQLQKLELDGANVTNAGLKHLSGMKSLTNLSLSGTKVTDEGMEELKNLPKLQFLNLYDTKVTDTGISLLKRWKIELNISN
jgi:internalin A